METVFQSNKCWGWFLGYGIILVLLGMLAIGASTLTTLVSILVLGTFLIIGGIIIFFDSFRYWKSRWAAFFLHLIMGILYFIIGCMLIKNPIAGALSLTVLLGMFFLIVGIFKIIASLAARLPYWGWRLTSGIVAMLLGLLILMRWPHSGLIVIGLFIGIDLLFTGWTYIMLSLASKPPKVTANS